MMFLVDRFELLKVSRAIIMHSKINNNKESETMIRLCYEIEREEVLADIAIEKKIKIQIEFGEVVIFRIFLLQETMKIMMVK